MPDTSLEHQTGFVTAAIEWLEVGAFALMHVATNRLVLTSAPRSRAGWMSRTDRDRADIANRETICPGLASVQRTAREA
jgi:hypothetical protein